MIIEVVIMPSLKEAIGGQEAAETKRKEQNDFRIRQH